MANVFDTAKYILEKSGTMSTMNLAGRSACKKHTYSSILSLVSDVGEKFFANEKEKGEGQWLVKRGYQI